MRDAAVAECPVCDERLTRSGLYRLPQSEAYGITELSYAVRLVKKVTHAHGHGGCSKLVTDVT